MPELHFVGTDLGALKNYFPKDLPWNGKDSRPKFNGDIDNLNW